MARPTKQGIDYFPLDTQFDDKIELYLLETEATGLAILVTAWQLIYQNEGYYISNNKDLHLLIKRRINVDINKVNECINICLDRGIFDKKLHKKYKILTSSAIQKRFFDAAKRKKSVQYDINYLINGVNVSDNGVNVIHQPLKGKGKGKGEEEVNVNNKRKYYEFVYLSKNEFLRLVKNTDAIKTKEDIKNLNNYIGSTGKKYKSHYHTILNWRNKNDSIVKAENSRVPKEDRFTNLTKKDYRKGAF